MAGHRPLSRALPERRAAMSGRHKLLRRFHGQDPLRPDAHAVEPRRNLREVDRRHHDHHLGAVLRREIRRHDLRAGAGDEGAAAPRIAFDRVNRCLPGRRARSGMPRPSSDGQRDHGIGSKRRARLPRSSPLASSGAPSAAKLGSAPTPSPTARALIHRPPKVGRAPVRRPDQPPWQLPSSGCYAAHPSSTMRTEAP